MDELEALARALRAEQPAIPTGVLVEQRRRLFADPRARVARPRSRVAALAIGFALIAAASFALSFWSARGPSNRTAAPALQLSAEGAAREHALDDGTRIRLEPGARGSIAPGEQSAVSFELERGRARFDVVRRAGRSFRVVAGPHRVQVIGTRFDVAYEPGGAFAVAVERGVVSVTPAGGAPVALAAGERLEALAGSVSVQRATARAAALAPSIAAREAPSSTIPAQPKAGSSAEVTGERSAEPDWQSLYRRREFAAALEAARRAGLERLTAELGAEGLADLADCARLGGDTALALALLRRLEQRFPGSKHGADASFLYGRVLLQSGQRAAARAAFERYRRENERGAYTNEAIGRLMELYTEAGDTQRAKVMAELYLARAPAGPYQRLARSIVAAP